MAQAGTTSGFSGETMMTESSIPTLRSSRIAVDPARAMPDGVERHDHLSRQAGPAASRLEIRQSAAMFSTATPRLPTGGFDRIFSYPHSIRRRRQNRPDLAHACPPRPSLSSLFESSHHE